MRADRSDGWGIGKLKKTGLPILVLSTEANPVVSVRADKLGLPCLQGQHDKWPALKGWLEQNGIDPAQVVYVGNDDNDLTCMANVGCTVAPADAYPNVLEIADLVLEHRGGDGAIRELCDLILQRRSQQPVQSTGDEATTVKEYACLKLSKSAAAGWVRPPHLYHCRNRHQPQRRPEHRQTPDRCSRHGGLRCSQVPEAHTRESRAARASRRDARDALGADQLSRIPPQSGVRLCRSMPRSTATAARRASCGSPPVGMRIRWTSSSSSRPRATRSPRLL